MTIIFLLAVVTLQPFAIYSGAPQTIFVLVSLLVCLIPTTIGGLLSAIGIAGMDRMIQRNVIAMSGRAVEASGDVDVLLLDKTGTITLGNRAATQFSPRRESKRPTWRMPRNCPRSPMKLLKAAPSSCWPRSVTSSAAAIFLLTRQFHSLSRHRPECPASIWTAAKSAKGAPEAIAASAPTAAVTAFRPNCKFATEEIANAGGTPLLVAENGRVLGAIALTDIVKGGMKERFDQLRAMGIRTMMITGDNPLTAAAIARQAGVDDFLAEAKPEDKMALIKSEQARRQTRGHDR